MNVPIDANDDIDVLVDGVDEIRATLDGALPDGLEAKVTGPAGFSADATAVFEGINSTLLFSAAALVFVLLVIIYRSPIFWIFPLLAVFFAEAVVRGLGYLLASSGVVINGQVGGILLILVFGAGTDYALLLTARYREELRRVEDKHEAMRIAVRQAAPAIIASAGTVVAALLCLMVAEVNTTAGLGPVGAMGIAVAAVAMLTLLPALLLIGGRRAFWPFVPRYGSEDTATRGAWRGSARWIDPRHRRVWIGTALVLGAMALGALTLDDELTSSNGFRGSVESVQGQQILQQSFPAGASAPTTVLVLPGGDVDAALEAARSSSRRRRRRGAGDRGAGDAVRGHPRRRPVLEGRLRVDRAAARGSPRRRGRRRARRRADGRGGRRPGGERARHARDRPARAARRLRDPRRAAASARRSPVVLMLAVVLSFFAAIGLSLVGFELLHRLPRGGSELRALRVHLPRRPRRRLQHLPDGARPRGGGAHADPRGDAEGPRASPAA